jgi:hypothetical protein
MMHKKEVTLMEYQTYEISTVGIHLATIVSRLNVDLRLVDESDDLNVGGSFHELYALECTSGDETGSSAGFGAPCDHLAFCVSDDRVRISGSPQAKI